MIDANDLDQLVQVKVTTWEGGKESVLSRMWARDDFVMIGNMDLGELVDDLYDRCLLLECEARE